MAVILPDEGDLHWGPVVNTAVAAVDSAATSVTSNLVAHTGGSDPHGDRAAAASDATSKVSTHTGASDPHGDRAWAMGRANSNWYNVMDYGAVGDGTTDDITAILAAVAACPPGGVVYLPKTHATTAPIVLPPYVGLRGNHGGHIDTVTRPTLKPKATFVGEAVITMVDQATGGYSTVSVEQRIENLTIEGSLLTGSTINGIQATGYVHGVYIDNVAIRNMPARGLYPLANGSGTPYSWHVIRLHVYTTGSHGINASMTDCTWIDCETLGVGGHGWFISNAANSYFLTCRAEWSSLNGFECSGTTGTGQGSGGYSFIGCSTDRNAQHGFNVTSIGNGPILISGCTLRRDGRGSTSAGYAAVNVSAATSAVTLSGVTVYPGVNDDGTGNNSPQYGLSATGSDSVVYSDCYFHVATTAVHDGGTNTRLLRGANIRERLGTTSSFSDVRRGLFLNEGGMDVTDHALGMAHPREHNVVAWSVDPAMVISGKSVVNGTLYLVALYVARSSTVTRLMWGINTAGAAATASQNYVGLINSAGTVLTTVGVDARVTSTGMFTETISVAVTPGIYWAAFLFNATTPPQVYRAGDLTATLSNAGITSASLYRFATNGTALTAVPGSITPGSNVISQHNLFAAIG